MCDECHQHPHATMCPNGTPMVDVIYAECVLCGVEEDETEIYYGICEKCWEEAHDFATAVRYGERARTSISINGLFAKMLTPEQINESLKTALLDVRSEFRPYFDRVTDEFLRDDDGDFADWLKEQKNID